MAKSMKFQKNLIFFKNFLKKVLTKFLGCGILTMHSASECSTIYLNITQVRKEFSSFQFQKFKTTIIENICQANELRLNNI